MPRRQKFGSKISRIRRNFLRRSKVKESHNKENVHGTRLTKSRNKILIAMIRGIWQQHSKIKDINFMKILHKSGNVILSISLEAWMSLMHCLSGGASLGTLVIFCGLLNAFLKSKTVIWHEVCINSFLPYPVKNIYLNRIIGGRTNNVRLFSNRHRMDDLMWCWNS